MKIFTVFVDTELDGIYEADVEAWTAAEAEATMLAKFDDLDLVVASWVV